MTYDCERCHWDKQKAQHFKDCPCKCHETVKAIPEIPRCEKCGWPLAESVDKGCVVGNCSMRPIPKKHAEDSIKFWSDKYDAKVDELHEMWKEARSFEGSFNSAVDKWREAQDCLDLMVDEFKRIYAITESSEIRDLCQRAQMKILQTVPVIKQRDALEAECARLRSIIERCKPYIQEAWDTTKGTEREGTAMGAAGILNDIEALTHPQEPKEVSDCCGASLKVSTTHEGTSCYMCEKCGKPCDSAEEPKKESVK